MQDAQSKREPILSQGIKRINDLLIFWQAGSMSIDLDTKAYIGHMTLALKAGVNEFC
jgi:hypothetical protein